MVTIEGRRHQVFIPASEFGDGWESVVLVVEGFARGESWNAKARLGPRVSVVKRAATAPLVVTDKPVQAMAEEGWFDILNKALVGLVGMEGDKGVGFSVMTEWVGRWWGSSRKVEIRLVGGQDFLFVFPSHRDAENVLRCRWVVDGRDLRLQWWSLSVLCDKGNPTPSEATTWVRVLGLPIHLRGLAMYRPSVTIVVVLCRPMSFQQISAWSDCKSSIMASFQLRFRYDGRIGCT